MKIIRKNEYAGYEAAGHFNVKCERIHAPQMSGTEHLIMSVSCFEPGGGAETAAVGAGAELIYYIAKGEMELTTPEGKTILRAGDSAYFKAGDERSVLNVSSEPAEMLVIISK